ncbi:MAG: RecX family transcriptional regulator [Candidatus Coatesbacteria bacterium]|nr:RecX family transcriptional regulator [Candidatus Coatesbacteria bacterium]
MNEKDQNLEHWKIAVRIATRKPISKKELLKELKEKGINGESAKNLLTQLVDSGIYSEIQSVNNIIIYYKDKGKGRFWILQELLKRGFQNNFINDQLKILYSLDEEEEALFSLYNKYMTEENDSAKRRFLSAVERNGFDLNAAYKLLKEE